MRDYNALIKSAGNHYRSRHIDRAEGVLDQLIKQQLRDRTFQVGPEGRSVLRKICEQGNYERDVVGPSRVYHGNENLPPRMMDAFTTALHYYSHVFRGIEEFRRIPDLKPDSKPTSGMSNLWRVVLELEDPQEHKRSFASYTYVLGDLVVDVGVAAAKDQQFTLEEAKRLWVLCEPLLESAKKNE
ncbi:hypothetical protein HYY71_03510 [Candidatus Woesearchaeota archaeon]|nr:hypothetical protein [Candidatus Woesearchaeota archaeon]